MICQFNLVKGLFWVLPVQELQSITEPYLQTLLFRPPQVPGESMWLAHLIQSQASPSALFFLMLATEIC